MKNKELFNETVSTLVHAFMNNELEKGNCYACAVGNICKKAERITRVSRDVWLNVFCTSGNYQLVDSSGYRLSTKDLIDATGYTWQELAKIEFAFETNTGISYLKYHKYTKKEVAEDQFNGLMAVVDVLIDIHEGTEEEKAVAKEMFVK